MEIKPLDSALGCEVRGIDLSQPLAAEDISQIRKAFLDFGVLISRDQQLSEEQFVNFARHFGPHESYESTLSDFLKPDYPDILVLSNIVENGLKLGVQDAGQYWHTDRSYVACPAWSSILYAKKIPHDENGKPLGDTMFSSSVAALAALPRADREHLRTLSAWHEYIFRFSKPNDSLPGVAHPVILPHPATGAECLYVNAGFTQKILDVSEAESKALLNSLYKHAARDEFIYRHQWHPGDVLMWDNYSTQHQAVKDYGAEQPRLMWRTTIKGFPLR